ncbi:geranylgeranylglycerol-phosphate geranylgeranyltransferase [Algibacter miyuki]|uniref:Geranylgeranylglycerol-phosphate geranylgeranyltransferase n=1 Tax=Algibacter miyuki TaxID=1306933 RepID=A0ABV5GYP6_9FLAO|nr:geranylgeranylglycerol-phosphate geranylgeranyltransferase [Algibacter miyuki]MDN3667027.1 geranylgeranylglycerol-phosphate geranylgeranyltransferase [Algibacter miyuki]
MRNFLNLIRWKNLLMIALAQLLIKYAFLEPFGVATTLDGFGISILIFATLCIAAAGNIINDIYDIETDFVNKPDQLIIGESISEKTGYNLFIAFNFVGVAAGFYISNDVGKSAFFSLFVIISALLYVYATYLKRTLLIGNIVISILVALSVLIVGIFELIPAITTENRTIQLTFFNIILDYAIFAFIINLLREITKDLEDIDGDYKAGMNTLPIAIGRERTTKILFILSLIPVLSLIFYVLNTLYKNTISAAYFIFLIIGPLLYISLKLFSAKSKKDYHFISNLLKLVMFSGVLSLLLYYFNLKY